MGAVARSMEAKLEASLAPSRLELTDESARMIYLAQLIGFALAFIVCMQPWLRRHLVPRLLQHDRAHRLATQQFAAQGLHKTAHRTGVMIFASQAERFAEIIADDGIDAKVAPDVWHGALVALLDGIKTDRPADGFVAAIAQCGEVLAAHFPRQASDAKVDELPDRLVEI